MVCVSGTYICYYPKIVFHRVLQIKEHIYAHVLTGYDFIVPVLRILAMHGEKIIERIYLSCDLQFEVVNYWAATPFNNKSQ